MPKNGTKRGKNALGAFEGRNLSRCVSNSRFGFEGHHCCAEIHRLRGVFLVALGPDEARAYLLALARAALDAMVMQLPGPQPHIDRLLRSLIKFVDVVPIEADTVNEYSELPSSWLKDVVIAAPSAGRTWRGYMDDRLRVWLFVTELSLPLSRKLGAPVLQVSFYRESGLQERGYWSVDRHSTWRRVVIRSPKKPGPDQASDEANLTGIDFYRPDAARK